MLSSASPWKVTLSWKKKGVINKNEIWISSEKASFRENILKLTDQGADFDHESFQIQ